MDIDHPVDLARFLGMTPRMETRTLRYLEANGLDRTVLRLGEQKRVALTPSRLGRS
jgi:hypothetical protein